MTIYFAAAQTSGRGYADTYRSRAATARMIAASANDNWDANVAQALSEPVIREALFHFAEHGLGAAQAALAKAHLAHARGDEAEYGHWLAILKVLDRQLAARLTASR